MLSLRSPLRVAVLCSHRAPGSVALLEHAKRSLRWDVVCAITTEPFCQDMEVFERAGVPLLTSPLREFHRERSFSLKDRDARASFDAQTVDSLRQFDVDVVLLLGYLYVVTDVLLDAFPGRVFNIHDSDLAIENSKGKRRYVGLHSTRDAIVAGELEIRSTLHKVTSQLDAGPIVIRSRAYPIAPFARAAAHAGHADIVRAYAYAQREWMMRDAWGSMAVHAIESVLSEPHPMTSAEAIATGVQLAEGSLT
ncbi:MAG TPA: formyltransferase family protein [Thermoanaerobaculia bacterium]